MQVLSVTSCFHMAMGQNLWCHIWVVIHIYKSHLFWCSQMGTMVLTHGIPWPYIFPWLPYSLGIFKWSSTRPQRARLTLWASGLQCRPCLVALLAPVKHSQRESTRINPYQQDKNNICIGFKTTSKPLQNLAWGWCISCRCLGSYFHPFSKWFKISPWSLHDPQISVIFWSHDAAGAS